MTRAPVAQDPRRVVVATADPDHRQRVANDLEDGDAFDVAAVADVSGVLDRLDGEDAVDCVACGSDLEDGDWRDLVDAVRERDPDLPILLHPSEPDPDVASEAYGAGVTDYAPRTAASGEALRARLEAAIGEYDRIRRLRAASQRYDALMETIPFAVYFKDEDARFVDASDPFLAAVGEDVVGRTDVDIWGDTGGESGRDSYHDDLEVIETGESIAEKEEFHDAGDQDAWMLTSKYPWRDDDGEVRGLIGMTRNVTDRRERVRELRQKSQRLEQFASFVSHDLRNPINIAQGYLDRAVETGDESALDRVDEALDRMDTLIDDLLATVRRGEESREWIEFGPFVERVWTATETENVRLEVDVREGTTVPAVSGQLRQVLDNLFRNADEHAPSSPRSHTPEDAAGSSSGEPSLADAREDADEHADENVTVTVGTTDVGFYVEDDGVGIEPDRREDVFEYGVTDGGTGIGLAIVAEIAESHGWEVEVTESDAGGARFEFANCPVRSEESQRLEPADPIPIDATESIGDPTLSGSYERDDDGETWTVHAGGIDVWHDLEEHFFAYGTVEGNARIVARVADLEHVDGYSKAGLMVRDWPDTGSSLAHVGTTPTYGTELIYRAFPGEVIETTQDVDAGGAPRWYRIDWIDDTATFLTSTDGAEWERLERRTLDAHDPIAIGLAVCSRDPDRTCRAVFEDVRAVELRPADDE